MNLFDESLRGFIQPTNLTKKLTLNGETKAYPVYRVNLEKLFYNDQNDRIATWISKYKADYGLSQFDLADIEEYNSIIQGFIVSSNPTAIEKTKRPDPGRTGRGLVCFPNRGFQMGIRQRLSQHRLPEGDFRLFLCFH